MTAILILVTAILIFLVFVQIARAGELLTIIKGKEEEEENSKIQGALLLVFLIVGMIAVVWSAIYYYPSFLPESASEHGILIDYNFNITLFFTAIVFFLTQILLFWFAYKYRQRKNRRAYYYPDNNKVEMAWTIVPAIVLTYLVVQGLTSWYQITGPEPEDTIVVEIVGRQFDWMIRYPGQDGEFGETELSRVNYGVNELGFVWDDPASRDDIMPREIVLPVDQAVLLRIRSMDVIHSVFMPHFRLKMDAVPGVPTRFWFRPIITTEEMREKTGNPDFNYELACAELCGFGHYSMRTIVRIVTQEEYEEWLDRQPTYYEMVQGGVAPVEEDETLPEDELNATTETEI